MNIAIRPRLELAADDIRAAGRIHRITWVEADGAIDVASVLAPATDT